MRYLSFALVALFSGCGVRSMGTGGDSGGSKDMATASDGTGPVADMAGCDPQCGGNTPHCNAAGHCVGCLVDGDCLAGQVCQITNDTTAACVPGCSSDDRCRPDGGGASFACCAMHCFDTATDPQNCGGCGKSCAVANATADCVASTCSLTGCDKGFDNCNGNANDGCEANLQTDVKNCGKCGNQCLLDHATPTCGGGCQIKTCDPDFGDCDMIPANGCESDLLFDPANCAGCGNACPVPDHGSPGCDNGNCGIGSCDQDWDDCNGDPNDGCESDLLGDVANCGGCGNQCGQGEGCTNGVCGKMGQFQIVSDGNWRQTLNFDGGWEQPNYDDSKWDPAFDEGPYSIAPWGNMQLFDNSGSTAHWIWYYDSTNGDDQSTVYFRGSFVATSGVANVHVTVDDFYTLYVNGVQVDSSMDGWNNPHDVQINLDQGQTNVIAVEATNTGGPGGLLLEVQ